MNSRDELSERFLRAALDEDYREATRLLREGANINYKLKDGDSALTLRVEWLDMVRFLLENGANPNIVDGNGDSVLFLAVIAGVIEVVKLLILHGGDVNQPANAQLGTTLLMGALEYRQIEIMKFLLRHGADPLQTDYSGRNLYKFAAENHLSQYLPEVGL